MIQIRKSEDRGRTKLGWLTSYHSFSFNRYYDPANLHFGPLRVLNDDIVMPGTGFAAHRHHNMEVVTYVLDGALRHRDSTGTDGVIQAGEVQRMTAGSGIEHSEYNDSDSVPVHFLQIWFFPNADDLTPSYEQNAFAKGQRRNVLLPVASGQKDQSSLFVNQDVTMYVSSLDAARELAHEIGSKHGVYLYLVDGKISVGDVQLAKGDAVKVTQEKQIEIRADADSEIVLFDVPLSE
jgi:redox-sensitive bicupin YhaK (pirin superfamily)